MKTNLLSLVSKRELVPTYEGSEPLEVKGLSLRNITALIANYKDTLGTLISKEDGMDIEWQKLLLEAPEFCTEVMCMALGAKTDDEREAVEDLPIGIQIDVMIAVWNMSSIDPALVETAAKKILALLNVISTNLGLRA